MGAPAIVLRDGRERSLLRRHPWVFSGAVATVLGDPGPGDTVAVRTATGTPLGWAAYSAASQIVARMWTFEPDERVDETFIAAKVARAAAARAALAERTDAVRVVYAESDGLPGVIADRFADVVVVQLSSAGAERWRDALFDALAALPGVRGVYERSDVEARGKEGLERRHGEARGTVPDAPITVHERDRRFAVDVRHGHKTGFYLDQRDNRDVVAGLARGRTVLDVCCYTGGFSVAAFAGGASEVTSVDSSAPALELAAANLRLNGHEAAGLVQADVFTDLRARRDRGERFGLVVLDPPKLAKHEGQVAKATRAYKDLNWLGLRLLEPGGHLVTFSCSGAVDEALLQKVVAGAALDARRDVQIVGRLTQASDHPVLTSFPEAAYLKGLVCLVR